MSERFKEIGDIGLTMLLRVSQQGGGLYLYLPKDLVDNFGLLGGDRIEVKLMTIRRRKQRVEEAEKE